MRWNKDSAAELVSTAGGFKPACEKYDENIPPDLKNENATMQLCDASGNKVTIGRTQDGGWQYETTKQKVTVSSSGIVSNVEQIKQGG